jgi:hypothetical protein
MKADLAKERLEAVAKRIREIKPMTHDFKYAKNCEPAAKVISGGSNIS